MADKNRLQKFIDLTLLVDVLNAKDRDGAEGWKSIAEEILYLTDESLRHSATTENTTFKKFYVAVVRDMFDEIADAVEGRIRDLIEKNRVDVIVDLAAAMSLAETAGKLHMKTEPLTAFNVGDVVHAYTFGELGDAIEYDGKAKIVEVVDRYKCRYRVELDRLPNIIEERILDHAGNMPGVDPEHHVKLGRAKERMAKNDDGERVRDPGD